MIYLEPLPIPVLPETHSPPSYKVYNRACDASSFVSGVSARSVPSTTNTRILAHRLLFQRNTPSTADSALVLGRLLRRDEEPPEGDDESKGCGDAECPRRPYLVEDGPAGESSEDEEKDRHDFMVACNDEAAEVEELRLGHEFAPRRGQDD